MIVKLIAALMFVAAGGIAGLSKASELRENIGLCQEISDILDLCDFQIRCHGLDVYGICREIKQNCKAEFVKNLPDFYSPDENFHSQWESAVSSQNLPDEEKSLLIKLGDTLGKSDAEGQLNVISALKSELGRLREQRNKIYLQKGKLYRSIGLLFGVMAGILIM